MAQAWDATPPDAISANSSRREQSIRSRWPSEHERQELEQQEPPVTPVIIAVDAQGKRGTETSLMTMETAFTNRSFNTKTKRNWWLIGAASNAIISGYQFGYAMSALNTCLNLIVVAFEWCGKGSIEHDCQEAKTRIGAISAAPFIGAVTGCIIGGPLTSKGRRLAMMVMQAIFLIGGGITAAATEFWLLFFGRVITGAGIGLATVATPVYNAEMVPAQVRGAVGVLQSFMVTVGIFLAVAFGVPQRSESSQWPDGQLPDFERNWWRFIVAWNAFGSVISMTLFLAIYRSETPQILMERGKTKEALKILQKVYPHAHSSSDGVQDQVTVSNDVPVETLLAQSSPEAQSVFTELHGSLATQRNGAPDAGVEKLNIFQIAALPRLRGIFILTIVMSMIQQLCGSNAFMSASTTFFVRAGSDANAAILLSLYMSILLMVVSVISACVIDRVGRRAMFLSGLICQTIFITPTAILFWIKDADELTGFLVWIPVISLIGFIASFAWALGPIIWVFFSEIYPSEARSSAIGFAAAINWSCSALSAFAFPLMSDAASYTIFSLCCVAGVFVVFFFVIETSGKSIDSSPYLERYDKREAEKEAQRALK